MGNHTDLLHNAHRTWRLRIAFVIGCFIVSGVSAFAGIALELKTPKSVYLLDEPIYATVTLHNTGQSDVKVFRFLELGHDMLSVIITSPDGETYRLNSMVQVSMTREGMMSGIIRLYPDKSFGSMLEIMNREIPRDHNASLAEYGVEPAFVIKRTPDSSLGHHDEYTPPRPNRNIRGVMRKVTRVPQKTLGEPGRYLIRCVYTANGDFGLDPSPIRSNKLIVRIDAPKGDDLLVHEALLKKPGPFGVWDIDHGLIPAFESLIESYPGSAYAPYIKCHLAESCYSHALISLRGKDTRYPMMKKAAGLFSQAGDESVGSPMSPYFKRRAGRSYAMIGDNDKAVASMIESFISRDSAEQDRIEALSWLTLIEAGIFQRDAGIVEYAGDYTFWAPLESFAESMGYTVRVTGKTVNLLYANLAAAMDTSKGTLTINDGEPVDVRVSVDDGRILVSPQVIGRLMAAKYGIEGSRSFKYLIDEPALP